MEKTILVVTDIHYISSSVHHFCDAFLSQMAKEDGKMTILSNEIMDSLVHYVIDRKPDAFVVTGDLSWNGDIVSHDEIRNYLLLIQNAGIPVYVIPGNHDIGKERKKYYAPFCSVLPECADKNDFERIYAPFLIQDDTASISYVKEFDDLRLLLLDVNGTDHPGIVDENTLLWLDKRLSQSNTPCIAFSHQNFLVLHPMFVRRRITNGDDLLKLLNKHHIHIGFSGHSHLQRIARNTDFTDICTACLSAYEHHIGVIHVKDTDMEYRTESLPVYISADTTRKTGIACSEDEKQYFLSAMQRIIQLKEKSTLVEEAIISFYAGHPSVIFNADQKLSGLLQSFAIENDMNHMKVHI